MNEYLLAIKAKAYGNRTVFSKPYKTLKLVNLATSRKGTNYFKKLGVTNMAVLNIKRK